MIDGSLNNAFQFPYIARPTIIKELMIGMLGKTWKIRALEFSGYAKGKMICQKDNILFPDPQRRQGYHIKGQPSSKSARNNPFFAKPRQVLVCSPEDSCPALQCFAAANRSNSPYSMTRSNFSWSLLRHGGYFIKKNRPAARPLKTSEMLMDSTGIRPGLMAKQLGLEQRLGQSVAQLTFKNGSSQRPER